jgi:hypothetical protein
MEDGTLSLIRIKRARIAPRKGKRHRGEKGNATGTAGKP